MPADLEDRMATAERDIRDHSKTLTELVNQLGRVLTYQEEDRIAKARDSERDKGWERRFEDQDKAIEEIRQEVRRVANNVHDGVAKLQWIIIGAFVTAFVVFFANQWLLPKV